MIVITGGAGFIGSNLVHALNKRGRSDLVVVDNLTNGEKFRNIRIANILDYVDQDDFLKWLSEKGSNEIDAVFHLGACSDTTEWDGRYMMENNYQYSKNLLNACLVDKIPLIYASSAAVYGAGQNFQEAVGGECPLNVYGYSKALMDRYVDRLIKRTESQIVGLRYFNVYGPREQHKAGMASVAYHHYEQMTEDGIVKLFAGSDGFDDGDQQRDFIYVDDAVAVNLWFLDNPGVSGVFNCGTGRAEPFNAIAQATLKYFGGGEIKYIPFPEHLFGKYQSYTRADISKLRQAGYRGEFRSVSEGVSAYLEWLHSSSET